MPSASDRSGDRVGGVCMVRDAVDIAPFTVGHYLRLGFDRIHIVDDGSTDGTYEFLRRLEAREPRLSVARATEPGFAQAAIVSNATNALIAEGVRLVFPFDIDEFWDLDLTRIRASARERPAGTFLGAMQQFVQVHNAGPMSAREMLRVRFRAPLSHSDACLTPVYAGLFHKVGVKSSEPVAFHLGSHMLTSGPTETIEGGLELFHLPIRSPDEINKRARAADRILAASRPGECWHFGFFRDAVADGRLAQAWAACSADPQGFLNVGGERVRLIRDTRLRAHLVKAWLHMLARHGNVLGARALRKAA